MRRVGLPGVALAAAVALSGSLCGREDLVVDNVDEPTGDASAEAASDADAPHDGGDAADGPGPHGSGPITLVVSGLDALTERLCDVDGDGREDNALADLGSPGSELLAGALSVGLAGAIERGIRLVFHMPLVDDLSGPDDESVVIAIFRALDEERCNDEGDLFTDDFSGEEPFCAKAEYLDDCGEPVSAARDARIVDGVLTATTDQLVLAGLEVSGASLSGTVAPGGASAEATVCGYATAAGLQSADPGGVPGGHTLLDVFVAGGAALGMPSFPGISMDIDVDGDGLERLEADDESRLARCIDGDGTVIEGARCWEDERIADGYSLAFAGSLVSAVFAGREPGWDDRECPAVLDRLEACPHGPECLDFADTEICTSQGARLAAVVACSQDRCAGECTEPPIDCRACTEAECAAELAACLDAPLCCPDPPEPSLFDPV